MIFVNFFKSRSLILTSSIVISVLFVVMIGLLSMMSYKQQREAYLDEFQQYGTILGAQVTANEDLVTTVRSKIAANEGNQDIAFSILKRQLNAMVDGLAIANAYVFSPEKVEEDGKSYLINYQENQTLTDAGFHAGDKYELSPTFLAGYEKAIKDGHAITEPFTDSVGEWITYLTIIKDGRGEPIATFGIDFNYSDVRSKLNSLLWSNLGIGVLFIVISIMIVILLIRLAVRPLRRLAELSSQAAEGDLTVSVPVTGDHEIGRAAAAFNKMISSLRDLAANIRTTSAEVSESASNLQLSSSQTAEAAQEIAESIQTVAAGSDTQLKSSQECQRAMSEMAVGIQRIAESSAIVSELAAETSSNAAAGEEVIGGAVKQMQTIEHNISESVEVMYDLQQLSKRVSDIMALISDVAAQTNLLALNASIEAARAGEHGKGFAVVAHEIRKLAERSRASSEQIADILKGISARTVQAVESLELSMQEARTGTAVASEAGDTFRSIVQAIQHVTGQVQEVSASTEQLSASSEEIAASLEELERIASFSSQQTEGVAASSEEQLATMEEVASASEQLRELADSLNSAIGRFRV
ncbi:methyl-accepting chemotaxis protein [Paenibacillus sp. GCM10027626]|uniref:methyl-accepting chemotaxis protein n=1 Tax=Paenibacillus sp. GCM10027626 TaxID=3273411 RepID=UPI00362D39D5